MEQKAAQYDKIEWTPFMDLHLLNAIAGLRAVGVNYNFCMVIIADRFKRATQLSVSIEDLKQRLASFYDFKAAESLVQEVPFPNDVKDFELGDDFKELMEAKRNEFFALRQAKIVLPRLEVNEAMLNADKAAPSPKFEQKEKKKKISKEKATVEEEKKIALISKKKAFKKKVTAAKVKQGKRQKLKESS